MTCSIGLSSRGYEGSEMLLGRDVPCHRKFVIPIIKGIWNLESKRCFVPLHDKIMIKKYEKLFDNGGSGLGIAAVILFERSRAKR